MRSSVARRCCQGKYARNRLEHDHAGRRHLLSLRQQIHGRSTRRLAETLRGAAFRNAVLQLLLLGVEARAKIEPSAPEPRRPRGRPPADQDARPAAHRWPARRPLQRCPEDLDPADFALAGRRFGRHRQGCGTEKTGRIESAARPGPSMLQQEANRTRSFAKNRGVLQPKIASLAVQGERRSIWARIMPSRKSTARLGKIQRSKR